MPQYYGTPEWNILLQRLENNDPTLISLDLDFNNIGAEGAQALAVVLKDNRTLASLSLSCNDIHAEGAQVLAVVLKDNCTLTSLDLRFNDIGAEGTQALAAVLKDNHTLTSLDLRFNNIDVAGAQALATVLKDNHTLTSLNLSYNNIDAEGAQSLATVLKDNHTLTLLNLSNNMLGVKGAQALAVVLKDNHTLTSFDFSYNDIGAEEEKVIEALLTCDGTSRSELLTAVSPENKAMDDQRLQHDVSPFYHTEDKDDISVHMANQAKQVNLLAVKAKESKTPLVLADVLDYLQNKAVLAGSLKPLLMAGTDPKLLVEGVTPNQRTEGGKRPEITRIIEQDRLETKNRTTLEIHSPSSRIEETSQIFQLKTVVKAVNYTALLTQFQAAKRSHFAPASTGLLSPPKQAPKLDEMIKPFIPSEPDDLCKDLKNKIGRWGEDVVYNLLKHHYQTKYNLTVSELPDNKGFSFFKHSTSLTVIWHNKGLPEDEDSKHPHDITITKTKLNVCRQRCVEVKTTRHAQPTEAKLSARQLQEMREYGKDYRLFRVYDAGSSQPRVRIIKDPAKVLFGETKDPRIEMICEIKLKI